jgi:hypothetical protein
MTQRDLENGDKIFSGEHEGKYRADSWESVHVIQRAMDQQTETEDSDASKEILLKQAEEFELEARRMKGRTNQRKQVEFEPAERQSAPKEEQDYAIKIRRAVTIPAGTTKLVRSTFSIKPDGKPIYTSVSTVSDPELNCNHGCGVSDYEKQIRQPSLRPAKPPISWAEGSRPSRRLSSRRINGDQSHNQPDENVKRLIIGLRKRNEELEKENQRFRQARQRQAQHRFWHDRDGLLGVQQQPPAILAQSQQSSTDSADFRAYLQQNPMNRNLQGPFQFGQWDPNYQRVQQTGLPPVQQQQQLFLTEDEREVFQRVEQRRNLMAQLNMGAGHGV